jgi:hypothetical protein
MELGMECVMQAIDEEEIITIQDDDRYRKGDRRVDLNGKEGELTMLSLYADTENESFEISYKDMLSIILAPPQQLPPMMKELLKMSEEAEQPDGTRKYPIHL